MLMQVFKCSTPVSFGIKRVNPPRPAGDGGKFDPDFLRDLDTLRQGFRLFLRPDDQYASQQLVLGTNFPTNKYGLAEAVFSNQSDNPGGIEAMITYTDPQFGKCNSRVYYDQAQEALFFEIKNAKQT